MKDAFGIEIEPGDYVMSSATATGSLKTGRVYVGGSSLMLDVAWSRYRSTRRVALGSNVIVLQKRDGTPLPHLFPGMDGDAMKESA